jgi:hypothetical protein
MNVQPRIITSNILECEKHAPVSEWQETIRPIETLITMAEKESGNPNNSSRRDCLHYEGQLLRELGCCIGSWAPLA